MQKLLKTFLCIYILGTIGLLAFDNFFNHRKVPRYVPEHERLDQEIIERLKTKWNLQLFGIGGGGTEHLRLMIYAFNAYDCRPQTLEEARAFVVECAEMTLDLVNRDEKIRPYLPIPRMQSKNLRLELSFPETKQMPLKNSGFDRIILTDGKILYRSLPENKFIHDEIYSEALKLVQAQKSSLANDLTPHAKTP